MIVSFRNWIPELRGVSAADFILLSCGSYGLMQGNLPTGCCTEPAGRSREAR
jgi:hypothetical protein